MLCSDHAQTSQEPGPSSDCSCRPQTPSASAEINKRVQHLEKLLRHYAGNISLEADDLRDLAEAIDKERPAPHQERSVSQGSDQLGADEERFTVQPLGNNITRETLLGITTWTKLIDRH